MVAQGGIPDHGRSRLEINRRKKNIKLQQVVSKLNEDGTDLHLIIFPLLRICRSLVYCSWVVHRMQSSDAASIFDFIMIVDDRAAGITASQTILDMILMIDRTKLRSDCPCSLPEVFPLASGSLREDYRSDSTQFIPKQSCINPTDDEHKAWYSLAAVAPFSRAG